MTVSDKINILIVEDNEDHLFFIKKALSDSNYILQHIVSGPEAYNYLLNPKIKPDVVLLDNHLPGMSGLEILKKLGAKTKDYGFIVTTVDKDPEIIVDSMRAGALDFSPKTPEYFYILPQRIDKVYRILKDKLEKKQLEKVLKSQQKALEVAEKMAKLGSFTLDLLTYKGQISKAFKTITGFKENRLIDFHKNWRKIVHPDDVDANQKMLDHCIKTGEVWEREYRIITLDTHKIKWIYGKGKIVFKDKVATNLIGVIQDITERKKNEEELYTKNQFLSQYIKSTPLATILFDPQFIIKKWNPAAEAIFGYTAAEAIGKNVLQLIAPPNLHQELEHVRNEVFNESGGSTKTNENITKSGKHILCRWHNSVIKDQNNKVIGLSALGENITKQTHLENTIKHIEKSLSFKTGKDYNISLAKELNKALKADYVVIAHYDKKIHTNNTLVHLLKNRVLPNISFNLEGTACERVINEGYFFQEKDISKHFKVDKLLLKLQPNSYMGAAIYNVNKECIGSIGAMFSNPIAEEEAFKIIMQFFADKIAADIDKNKLIEQLFNNKIALEEAQQIAKLGHFVYDSITETFETSQILDTIVGVDSHSQKNKQGWLKLCHPDDLINVTNIFNTANKKNISKEFRLIRFNDKKIIWVLVQVKEEFDKKTGQRTKIKGTVKDITARKQAEEKLKQSEKQFAMLMEQSPNVIELYNLDGLQIKVNKAYETLWGFSASKTVNKFNVLKSEEVKNTGLIDYVNRAYNGESVTVPEYQFNPTGATESQGFGRVRWLATNIYPLTDGKGKVTNIVITHKDISDRKLAEQNLIKATKETSESEKKYRNLFEKNHAVMLIIDPADGAIIDANPTACRYYGWTKEQLLTKNIADINTLSPSEIKKEMALAKTEERNFFNFEHKLANGHIHHVEVYSSPIVEKGKIKLYSIIHDVTQRKLAQVALRKTEDRLDSLYENAPLAYQSLNEKGYLIDVNLTWLKILGYKRNEVIGKHMSTFLAPESKELLKKQFPLFKASGKLNNAIFRMVKKDGTKITTSLNGNIGRDEEGNFKQTYCNFIDVTQIKKQELTKEIIFNITKKANESKDLSVLFKFIRTELNKLIDTTNFFIALYNADTDIVSTPYMVDEKDDFDDFPKGKSLTGYIIDSKKSLIGTHALFNKLVKEGKIEILGPRSQSWMGVPLLTDQEAIGAIVIQSYTEKKAYSQEDVALLELIASNISTAIKLKQDFEIIKQSDIILNKIESIVQVFDDSGNITYISPSVETVLGFKPKELLGQGWWQKTTHNLKEANALRKAVLDNVHKGIIPNQEIIQRATKAKSGREIILEWINSKGIGNTHISIGIDVTEKYEKERQLKTIINTANDAIILADHKGIIVDWNPTATTMFGYAKEEILDKPLSKLMPLTYIGTHKKAFVNSAKKGKLQSRKPRIVEGLTKSGKTFPVEISFNTWKEGNDLVYCAFIKDITGRQRQEKVRAVIYNITKKANEALAQELFFDFIKSELNKLIDTTNFFIALGNENSAFLTIPYRVDEKGTNDDFIKKNSLSGYVIDTKKSLLLKNSDKKNLKIKVQGHPSSCWLGVPLIIKNKVIGVIAVQSYTDENAYTKDDVRLLELIANSISQVIKQSEDFEQINLLSHALIQSDEAVIITNIEGNIQYVNPAFTKLSAYTEKEALGQNPRILKSSNQPIEFYENLWNTILSGNIWAGEFTNKRKDDTEYLVNANISPIKNEKGMITHFVAIEEDITEKRKLERDLIHAFIDAQEEEKISFGEDLHDGISQILSAEAMFIQVLIQQNKDVLNAQSLKYLESVKDLNIKAINEARSIAHGLMSKQLKENGLLKAIAHICKDYNGSKNIVFQYTHKGLKETDIAKAIKINIFRIIQEISTNTIRHSGAKKAEISLSKTQNNMLQLIYSDNGVGIDFEKMKQEKKGAGLKNIERRVTLLKGTYTLDSVLNKGIKYTVEVPLFNI